MLLQVQIKKKKKYNFPKKSKTALMPGIKRSKKANKESAGGKT